MSEKINELKVKLSGTVNVPRELLTNATLDLKIENAGCLDYRLVNNQNGTYNKVYNVKVSELSKVEFIKDKEKMIGEKKKSASQRLRGRAFIWCSENESIPLVIYISVVIAASVFNLVIYKKIWN